MNDPSPSPGHKLADLSLPESPFLSGSPGPVQIQSPDERLMSNLLSRQLYYGIEDKDEEGTTLIFSNIEDT
jgi:hypothetical protein